LCINLFIEISLYYDAWSKKTSNQYTFFIISRWILLRRELFQTKFCRKSKHILCSIIFLKKSYPFKYNVLKYGTAGQATEDNIIWRMLFLCWISKTTNTPSEYVIHIVFPQQKWLHEYASMLRRAQTACLVSKRK
jgi:hypothetical protein